MASLLWVVGGFGRSGVAATAASSSSIDCSDDLFYAFFFSRNNHRFIYSYIHSTLSLYLYNGYVNGRCAMESRDPPQTFETRIMLGAQAGIKGWKERCGRMGTRTFEHIRGGRRSREVPRSGMP